MEGYEEIFCVWIYYEKYCNLVWLSVKFLYLFNVLSVVVGVLGFVFVFVMFLLLNFWLMCILVFLFLSLLEYGKWVLFCNWIIEKFRDRKMNSKLVMVNVLLIVLLMIVMVYGGVELVKMVRNRIKFILMSIKLIEIKYNVEIVKIEVL